MQELTLFFPTQAIPKLFATARVFNYSTIFGYEYKWVGSGGISITFDTLENMTMFQVNNL